MTKIKILAILISFATATLASANAPANALDRNSRPHSSANPTPSTGTVSNSVSVDIATPHPSDVVTPRRPLGSLDLDLGPLDPNYHRRSHQNYEGYGYSHHGAVNGYDSVYDYNHGDGYAYNNGYRYRIPSTQRYITQDGSFFDGIGVGVANPNPDGDGVGMANPNPF